VWDRMWDGPHVTKYLVSDNWAHQVAYSTPPLYLSFQECAARDT